MKVSGGLYIYISTELQNMIIYIYSTAYVNTHIYLCIWTIIKITLYTDSLPMIWSMIWDSRYLGSQRTSFALPDTLKCAFPMQYIPDGVWKWGIPPEWPFYANSSRENDESVDLKILYHDFLTDPYSWWLRSHNISMSGLLKCNVRVMKSQLKNLEPSTAETKYPHLASMSPSLLKITGHFRNWFIEGIYHIYI